MHKNPWFPWLRRKGNRQGSGCWLEEAILSMRDNRDDDAQDPILED
jgi:hypothetical protein